MEENKPFMPPPPPKMPPPPPRANGEAPTQQAEAPASQPQPESVSAEPNTTSTPVVEGENAPQEQTSLSEGQAAATAKKEPKDKKQKLITALYWVGFVCCLITIGISIFLIVK